MSARKAIWNKVRVVACTASAALQVSRSITLTLTLAVALPPTPTPSPSPNPTPSPNPNPNPNPSPNPNQVSRRLERDMNEGLGKGKKADAGPPLRFDFVVLDEAAAMLEPDAIGCLLHG